MTSSTRQPENNPKGPAPDASSLRQTFDEAGQGQVFRHWEDLNESERDALLADAAEIDLNEIDQLVRTHLRGEAASPIDFSALKPAPFTPCPETPAEKERWEAARVAGEEAIRHGKIAAFTVAGGQGTRLGFDGPKGTFPVTPVAGKSLFQVFAEKILGARRRFETEILWFIMTSHANHDETVRFFRENQFFGLPETAVSFFRQGRMPAVDFDGKILLESRNRIAMSPDGHGGSLRALCRSGAIRAMEARGIEVISYFQVDNPLVQAIDPAFIGFHLEQQSEMSSKMIPKAYPEEKVGVFSVYQNKMTVVEYSDLPDEIARRRDENGCLTFLSGSIAIHLFSVPFVKRLGERGKGLDALLPFHLARKKIPTIDSRSQPVKPDAPNGAKFEMFVFDALPFAKNPLVIETRREDEFSAVKNAEGVDSPATCRADQLKQFARWFAAAGIPLERNSDGVPALAVEVSPLFATDERSFIESWNRLSPKPAIRDGLVLE